MTLYILEYNNYYNRLVKQEESLEQYLSYTIYEVLNTNFNPNDSVNTQHVIGNGDYEGNGDYLIAVNEDSEIVSRWFIINSERTRAGQWQLTLHRDLVVDYYNVITQSPMFIEKATVRDDDPAIYNTEGVSVNQIKTNEYLLKDLSDSAWIVGYFDRKYDGGQLEVSYSNPTVDIQLPEGQTIYQYINNQKATYLGPNSLSLEYADYAVIGSRSTSYYKYKATLSSNDSKWAIESKGVVDGEDYNGFAWDGTTGNSIQIPGKMQTLTTNHLNKLNSLKPSTVLNQSNLYKTTNTVYSLSNYRSAEQLNNKIIQTFEGKKYKIRAIKTQQSYSVNITTDISKIDNINSIYTYLKQGMLASLSGGKTQFIKGSPTFKYEWVEESIELKADIISFDTFTINFPAKNTRVHLNDAPYDMFCIPYKENGLYSIIDDQEGKYGAEFTSMDQLASLTVTQSLAQQMGQNLYDLQLLPFCPLQGWELDQNNKFYKKVNAIRETETGYASSELIYDENTHFVMFFCTSSSGSINNEQLNLISSETNEIIQLPLSMGNKKISNECDMYRLCSPNYNGQFQFSASKLNGITGFEADYTYLPYSPYIKINPIFSGLYGKDFDDARGLICQGDFSIGYMNSAWENYQIQNKNYANIFNRGTENLEINQKIQREQQVFNAITGTIMGGAAGVVTGSKGGVAGMIAGGVLGTAASAIGGALDVSRGDILRNEALDYRQDLFNYQLENIQAQPNSIAKVSAFTANNKIFPILEYYTCTDIEKQAIANKIAYNGMTVGRIGTMSEFLINNWSYGDITDKGYIKGQLIRYMDDGEDFRVVNSISSELYKGVFTK